ncbi:hypothetical protein FW774_06815 [Pedobacter sp. BS3]|uniref:hypothetical protein n=1 Tax=Pedobacter sp. BS3 TaxID=2567937 RepID=UPI0011EEC44C|nr:hypothetical protein [Pedobacter sp. BS3]TZF84688.1 hypothetical protein FW774_06815 [Pedobacter sp. BS3]
MKSTSSDASVKIVPPSAIALIAFGAAAAVGFSLVKVVLLFALLNMNTFNKLETISIVKAEEPGNLNR